MGLNCDEYFWNSIKGNIQTLNDVKIWWNIVFGEIQPNIVDQNLMEVAIKFFPEEGQAIRDWVTTLIFKYYSYLITGYGKIVHVNSWIARYDDGDSAKDHNHHPIDFNYIYYVNCPKGSSPLILTSSGKKIKAEEGKVVIFPGITQHYVPKNRCDNRIVVAGNVEMMA